jgi:tRNA nucleotidyltransferase (CCA-adding enzyme)
MPPLDPRPDPGALPAAVGAILATLRDAGFQAFLVGGCVRDLLRGLPVGDFDVATDAPPERVLALFPRAVPTGLRHGTVMIPGPAPVDVTTFRAGPRLEDDLAHRDFTVNAIAWDPAAGAWIDPFGGTEDLAAGRLRAVGRAADRFAEDPLRALRAARLVATLGLAPDPDLLPAMREARPGLRGVARERVRRELADLLLAPGAAAGLHLLRATGLEADLAPGAQDDAPAVVAALPPQLDLRLAGWLRGTRVEAVLRGLRFGQRRARDVARLLARHPIDRQPLARDADLRRLLARAGEDGVDALLSLRRAELAAAAARGDPAAAGARAALEALAARLARLRRAGALAFERADLALDGAAVMALLGVPPGPRVGAALRHLADCVLEDPACNTPEALAERLRAWAAAAPAPAAGRTAAAPRGEG